MAVTMTGMNDKPPPAVPSIVTTTVCPFSSVLSLTPLLSPSLLRLRKTPDKVRTTPSSSSPRELESSTSSRRNLRSTFGGAAPPDKNSVLLQNLTGGLRAVKVPIDFPEGGRIIQGGPAQCDSHEVGGHGRGGAGGAMHELLVREHRRQEKRWRGVASSMLPLLLVSFFSSSSSTLTLSSEIASRDASPPSLDALFALFLERRADPSLPQPGGEEESDR
eukprot:CAMPEP_0113580220 /NCGR_PEP_ID=MMETSP0015_2-20120614/30545_1 /TAXON_ID=2838 /ORGANISM="Odontella" /LENGTH=218 /DNA_ID=CAMNT_0000484371 /DNA_START=80 /DNA_END=734 /DNA_ORIENTATION=- /assembly_acc=CAM_ASM_000160